MRSTRPDPDVSAQPGCAPSVLDDPGHAEELLRAIRGVLQDGIEGKRLSGLVLTQHVHHRDGVRRRLNVVGVEFLQLGEVLQDAVQLAAQALGLLLGECQVSQLGHVRHIVARHLLTRAVAGDQAIGVRSWVVQAILSGTLKRSVVQYDDAVA